MGCFRSLVTGCYQAMVRAAFQELPSLLTTLSYGNPWSRMNSELPPKPTDGPDPLVTFTDASRNLHVTAGQTFYELLGAGVSSSGLHTQENETPASNSNIKIFQRPALLQQHSWTQLVTSYVFVNELCEIDMLNMRFT